MKIKKENINKVLFLARWYPNRYDPMPGLFIQRHAEAVAKYCQVGVVYTHVVSDQKMKNYEVETIEENDVLSVKVYYFNPTNNLFLLAPLIKFFRFYKANFIGIRLVKKNLGKIDIIHLNILTRLGLIALYYKWFHQIPYIVTEHWSRYLPLTGDFKGFVRKWFTRLVVKNAAAITTVTQNLANAMQSHKLFNKNYLILPNVVDNQFYQLKNTQNNSANKSIVHVSCFEDKSKNISGILRVISSLRQKRNDFIFKFIGEGLDFQRMKILADDLGLNQPIVQFTGLLEGDRLVSEMASADLMVVFSNYENFPVVINESFALGVPVIATSVGGIPEYVNDQNGKLVRAGDEKMLEKYLCDFLDNKFSFQTEEIRKKAQKEFSADEIGNFLLKVYSEALRK